MQIAIALFEGLTALDAIGPYEVLSRLPGASVKFVGNAVGVVRTDTKNLGLAVDATFDDVPHPDVLLVPGGPGVHEIPLDAPIFGWVRRAHETSKWTLSVCTGSLILGGAGILRGLSATTHWRFLDVLPKHGAKPVSERYVVEGKIVTAAGVSAGIDMGLLVAAKIAGDEVAKASPSVVEMVKERARQRDRDRQPR